MQLIRRHLAAAWYVLMVVLPVILRTGRRPVIFSRFAGMGDIIGSIPAALEIKKRHPGATFIYNCHASSACLPRMGGVTDFVTNLEHIGLIGYWYCPLLDGFYSFSSDDDDLTSDDTENSIVAFGKNHGVETSDQHPTLAISAEARQRAQAVLEQFKLTANSPLIILHTGPSSKVRQWPRENWTNLVQGLRQSGFENIVQLGARTGSYAGADEEEARPLPDVFSLVEKMALEESIALISMADLYVGIDSGLLHVAASVHTSSVGIWGPTTPRFRFSAEERKWHVASQVECQGCHHRMPRLHWENGCPHGIRCMAEIAPQRVLNFCLQALSWTSKKASPAT